MVKGKLTSLNNCEFDYRLLQLITLLVYTQNGSLSTQKRKN